MGYLGKNARRCGVWARPTGPRFSDNQKRMIFRQMVAAELQQGRLPPLRRRQLVGFAQRLGIGHAEADLLIAQAQYATDAVEPPELTEDPLVATVLAVPHRRPRRIRLALILLTILVVDLLVVRLVAG